jgi:hypothetical protein
MMEPSATESTQSRVGRVTDAIRREPLKALGAAAAVGFIFGGGASTRVGFAICSVLGRIAMREAALQFITGLVAVDGNGRGNSGN